MICKQCGCEYIDGATFCPNCGAGTGELYRVAQTEHAGAAQKVGFGQAVQLVFKNYANFLGRTGKSEFWWGFLFLTVVGVIGVILCELVPVLGGLIVLAFLLPNLSLYIRRLHDTGNAWTRVLIGLIPFAGFVILLIDCSKDSDGDNRWGPALPGGSTRPALASAQRVSIPAPAQPANIPAAQPTAAPVQAAAAPARNAAPAQKRITDVDIVNMAKAHAPTNLDTPEARAALDAALRKIVPTFTGAESLSNAMLQCDPQDIKNSIAETDTDTLLVIYKALDYYIENGVDLSILGLVQHNVLSTLKKRF